MNRKGRTQTELMLYVLPVSSVEPSRAGGGFQVAKQHSLLRELQAHRKGQKKLQLLLLFQGMENRQFLGCYASHTYDAPVRSKSRFSCPDAQVGIDYTMKSKSLSTRAGFLNYSLGGEGVEYHHELAHKEQSS